MLNNAEFELLQYLEKLLKIYKKTFERQQLFCVMYKLRLFQ